LRAATTRASDRTAAVTVEVAREHGMHVRGIRREDVDGDGHDR